MAIFGELRMDPFVNLHNCALDDEPLAIAELERLRCARRAHGRRPDVPGDRPRSAALARISDATGLQIVMGAGYYLQSSHPPAEAR